MQIYLSVHSVQCRNSKVDDNLFYKCMFWCLRLVAVDLRDGESTFLLIQLKALQSLGVAEIADGTV